MIRELSAAEKVNLHGQDTGRDHLSHTSLSTQLACLERFRFHYVDRLAPNVRPVALTAGDAFAQAIAAADPELGRNLVLDEHAGLIEEHGNDLWVHVPSTEDAEVTAQVVAAAARAYLHRYGHSERREVAITVRLRNPVTGAYSRTFDLTCRIDGLSHNGLTMIEDKLTGQVPRQDADRLVVLDRQISINAYCAWRATGIAIEELRYRWTLKPQIRRRKSESHDEFLDRIAADYQERPDHYLVEAPATRTPEDFLRLEHELWQWAAARREAMRAGVFPRNTASCQDFGGCRFLSLCSREPGAEQHFHVRPPADQVEEKNNEKEAVPA